MKAKQLKGVNQGEYKREGEYIYFGTYPQSRVEDDTIVSALNERAGGIPTISNTQNWTLFKFFDDHKNNLGFMWYIDVEYSGEKYRGVYYIYVHFKTSESSTHKAKGTFIPEIYSTDYQAIRIPENNRQNDKGYKDSTVYWFKYEPIKWRILNENGGEALILSKRILDRQAYNQERKLTIDELPNCEDNYEYSDIRAWLNDTFYNTAFNELEKQLIVQRIISGASSIEHDDNDNKQDSENNDIDYANKQDYVFLLSEEDVTTSTYGFDKHNNSYDPMRIKEDTDYAKCLVDFRETDDAYTGNGFWWLRAYNYNNTIITRYVSDDGCVEFDLSVRADRGVAPAMKIRIE